MPMQPHQLRVVEERIDLEEKIHNLTAFMTSARVAQVSLAESYRMRRQLQHMQDYSRALLDRINAFEDA